jgi:hypothetical protein
MSDDGLDPNAKVFGLELRLDMAVEGIKSAFPPGVTEVYLRGIPYTQPLLLAEAQNVLAPWKGVRGAKGTIRTFANSKPATIDQGREFLGALLVSMASHYGEDDETLTKFGFKPKKKRKPLSSEKEVIRVAKAKKTRELRGTKGKRQKAAIKFDGDAHVLITPDAVMHVTDVSVPPPAAPQPEGNGETPATPPA